MPNFGESPQRRRRIYLVADFGGQSAPEILFKREGLPGYPAPGRIEGQGTAVDSQGSLDEAGWVDGRGRFGELASVDREIIDTSHADDVVRVSEKCPTLQSRLANECNLITVEPFVKSRRAKFQGDFETWVEGDVNPTLNAFDMGDVRTTTAVVAIENHPADSRVTVDDSGTVQTLTSRMGTGGGNVPMTMQLRSGKEGGGKSGCNISEDITPTLTCTHGGEPVFLEPTYCLQGSMIEREEKNGPQGDGINEDVSFTLNTIDRHAVYSIDRESFSAGVNFPRTPGISDDGTVPTLVSAGPGAVAEIPTYCSGKASHFTSAEEGLANTLVATDYKEPPPVNVDSAGQSNQSVRRLTPLECERLQGYPDGWTTIPDFVDGKGKTKTASDSARYKALGNSVALPNVYYVLFGIAEQLGFEGTIGSLFDGIAGFPICWENLCGEGTALWASEIEEFPIAVTEYHFGGDRG